ncbi:MAG: hypothetical protein HY820_13430 [Acidobacteria bacterium]|nr:hypothetical protein [Acidobacteriota bacterium]
MIRSADGKMRLDSGDMSVITDPTARTTMILDHLKKEARIGPMDPPLPKPPLPGMPQIPAMPQPPQNPIKVEDLGKSMIDGMEVIGKRYTLPPPPAPPQMPGMPQMPQVPQNTISEVWTSTQLQIPVLTKTTGSFGEQITKCKAAAIGEPAPANFQIPPGYKVIQVTDRPEVPKVPDMTKAPKAPKPPKLGL